MPPWLLAAFGHRLGTPAILGVTGILILSRPGRAALESGQATIFYTLVTYVAWSQARKRPLLAAVALACALGKPPFGLPLLALILARRLWPVALRGLAIFVAGSLPILIWLSINAGSPVSVWHAMVHNLQYTDGNPLDTPGSAGRIDALSIVARYVHAGLGGGPELVAFVLFVALASVALARVSRRPGWPVAPAVLLLLGTVTLLSVAHEYYDLLLLTWPFAAVAGGLWAQGSATHRSWDRALAVIAAPALIVSVIPANDSLKILGLGSGTAIVSTLTTACLLVTMAGAMVSIAGVDLARRRAPSLSQTDPRPSTTETEVYRPSGSWV